MVWLLDAGTSGVAETSRRWMLLRRCCSALPNLSFVYDKLHRRDSPVRLLLRLELAAELMMEGLVSYLRYTIGFGSKIGLGGYEADWCEVDDQGRVAERQKITSQRAPSSGTHAACVLFRMHLLVQHEALHTLVSMECNGMISKLFSYATVSVGTMQN